MTSTTAVNPTNFGKPRDESNQMEIRINDKVVVFDYGEVISNVPTDQDRAQIIELAGVEPEGFWRAYWHHRDALDEWRISIREYWSRIQHDVGADWDSARLHSLWLADLRGWMRINPGVLDILLALQRGGTRMALLSNAGRDYASYFRYGMLGDFFERVFISGELGTLKPGEDIFRTLLSGLDVTADRVLFIDNKKENIEGARALGIEGHVFTTVDELRAYLEGFAGAAPVEPPPPVSL